MDSFFTIRSGTFCNKDSDWHTMRIHGQMCFGVAPPLLSWHILIVTFCSRYVGMHPDMAGVD